MAVVTGDPTQAQPFVVRAQMPAGYKIPPHWHPTDEHITVLSGTVALGMGDAFDPAALKDLSAGGYTSVPADMHHFFMAIQTPRSSGLLADGRWCQWCRVQRKPFSRTIRRR